jgi:hypothetical protein
MINTVPIQAWVIRQSAFSIQCGGLERLFIHFSKPKYYLEILTEKERDIPFGFISTQAGIFRKVGWVSNDKTWIKPLSVGNWIGYDNPVSDFIWDKLKEHFKNKPFDDWHLLEQSGECKVEDFLLEIDLLISLK